MKDRLNKLLMALGAIQEPIEDEAELSIVSDRIADHFSEEKAPPKKYWYTVFLELHRAGPVVGSAVVTEHPLIWNKKQAQGQLLLPGAPKKVQTEVISITEIDEATFNELSK
jgi:hypothetical protein